jgi:hypothetical protein
MLPERAESLRVVRRRVGGPERRMTSAMRRGYAGAFG